MSIWSNQPSHTGAGFTVLDDGAAATIFTEIPHTSAANGYVDVGALFDSGKDNSGWTAAEETIMRQALDSTGQYRFGGSFSNSTLTQQLALRLGWDPDIRVFCKRPPPVPEPSTLLMVGGGLVMLVGLLRGRPWGRRAS